MMRTPRHLMACVLLSILTLAATSCSPGGTGTTLLEQTDECIPQFDSVGNTVACTIQLFFNPTAANQTITVTVRANLTDSRPAFTVADINNNIVATVPTPTVNNPSATFTSSNTTVHSVFVSELINARSNYTITVVGS